VPQAINTGDGVFALAHLALWRLLDEGIAAEVVGRLAVLVDHTSIELCEGQYLDMSFERRNDVTADMYLDMIGRKTGSLMACATEAGGWLGAPDRVALRDHLATFGRALGLAFQLRDDLLGIWARHEQLGKTEAGDVRRKKMSLPVIHALETATPADRETLASIYGESGEATESQIAAVLKILERTHARQRVGEELLRQVAAARAALNAAAGGSLEAEEPRRLLDTLITYIEVAA
jgi:geranylgeranyl diphosphate synthase type I